MIYIVEVNTRGRYARSSSHLEHARDVLLGDGTTLDVGHKLEASSGLAGLELDRDVGELAGTTRLLLVRVCDVSALADRLPVVDLRRKRDAFSGTKWWGGGWKGNIFTSRR